MTFNITSKGEKILKRITDIRLPNRQSNKGKHLIG